MLSPRRSATLPECPATRTALVATPSGRPRRGALRHAVRGRVPAWGPTVPMPLWSRCQRSRSASMRRPRHRRRHRSRHGVPERHFGSGFGGCDRRGRSTRLGSEGLTAHAPCLGGSGTWVASKSAWHWHGRERDRGGASRWRPRRRGARAVEPRRGGASRRPRRRPHRCLCRCSEQGDSCTSPRRCGTPGAAPALTGRSWLAGSRRYASGCVGGGFAPRACGRKEGSRGRCRG